MKLFVPKSRTRLALIAGVLLLTNGGAALAQTGSGWSGGTSSDMQTASNWDNGFGSNFNLFIGVRWNTNGRTGSTTINNASNYSGYRFNFENLTTNQTFTLQGSQVTLFDFGGSSPAVINASGINQNVNFTGGNGLVFNSGTGVSLIQVNGASGGNLTFGGPVNLAGTNNQLQISGTNANSIIFNGVISSSTTGTNSVVANQGSSGTTTVYAATNTYTGDTFIDSGTLQFGTSSSAVGTANSSTLRLGQNTVNANSATISLANLTGGQTIASSIEARSGNTGGLNINSLNTSNSNTLSGNFFLNSNLAVNQSGAGGTLLLGAAASANTISFQSAASRTLTLNASGSSASAITVNESFTNVLNGTDVVVFTGAGTTTIASDNSASGANLLLFNPQGGTLAISSANNLGSPVVSGTGYPDKVLFGAVSGATTSTLLVNGTFSYGSTTAGQILGLAINRSTAANTAVINVSGSNVFTLNGAISDFGAAATVGKLQKSGTGTLVLNAASTYAGGTTLSAGILTGTTASAFGSGLITINAASTTLNLRNDADTTFSNNGLTLTGSATTTVSADQATGAGTGHTLTLGGTVSLASGASLSIATANSYVLGLGPVVVTGSSTPSVTFTGAGTGVLASVTGSVPATTSTVVFQGTGTDTITGNVLNGGGALSITKNTGPGGTLILQGTGSNYSGATTITNGTIRTAVATNGFGNTSGISIGGSGILDLRNDSSVAFSNGTTNYAVSTSATGATINVDNNNSAVTNRTLTIGTLTMGATHTLNITGGNDGYTLATGAVTANGNETFNPTSASVSLASITGTNRNIALSGTSTGNSVGAISTGIGTLSKNSSSTWTLTASNSFTGTTTINAGTLIAGATGALGNTASVTVNSGGTLALGGSGNLNRINDSAGITLGTTSGAAATFARTGTASEGVGASRNGITVTGTSTVGLGALTLASNSTLDFGTGGVGTLAFSSFIPAGFVLNIINYTNTTSNPNAGISGVDGTDDRLIFNQDQAGNLANFSFNGISATEILLDSGFWEVTPVPEPSTWVAGALVFGTLLVSQRRRLLRKATA